MIVFVAFKVTLALRIMLRCIYIKKLVVIKFVLMFFDNPRL